MIGFPQFFFILGGLFLAMDCLLWLPPWLCRGTFLCAGAANESVL